MKSRDIEIGGTYTAKVSGIVVPVRVLSLRPTANNTGQIRMQWRCVNTKTGREIIVKSPLRFRRPATEPQPAAVGYGIWVPADGGSYDD